jgi:hypothetical protein
MKNIKWNGDKKDFLNFAKDYVINIHERCRDPKTPEDHQLRKDMENMEIQIIGTLNGVDVLEVRFVKKPPTKLPTAEEIVSNHYGEIYDAKPEGFKGLISKERFIELNGFGAFHGTEKSIKDLLINFATIHVQACKEDIAASIEYDQDHALHRQSVLQAYPESNIQ